jgi:signal transduction histidine kinase
MTSADRLSPTPHPRRLPVLLLTCALACLGLSEWATVATPHLAPASAVVRETLFALSWIVVGAVAIWLGRTQIALRILTLALVLSANFAGSFEMLSQAPYARLIETVTVLLIPLQTPVAGHLLLTYPSGRLASSFARRIVVAGYLLGIVEAVVWALERHRPTCPECVVSFTYVGLPASFGRPVAAVIAGLWFLLVGLLLWQLARQYADAGRRQRRLLRLPYVAIVVCLLLFGTLVAVGGVTGRSTWGMSPAALIAMQIVALLGVPLSFLIGLLRERLSYKRIGEFVVDSAAAAEPDLERALGTALGDPGLRVAFPVDGGYVDPRGNAVEAPGAGATTEVTIVGDDAAPLALVTHDRSLSDEPALLMAAGSATRLLLENARLQAEVRAQLLEVRESRSRIVEAANEARARLERDLHDGAQQRLLAIGIALNLLESNPADTEVLGNAKDEVAGALSELRSLAAGIHPAVLTDLGLAPALDALAQRMGPLVNVVEAIGGLARMSPAVEAAAYFSTAEAVTNAVKHASAARIDVVVEQRDGLLVVTVADDGLGGADPEGRGFVGVRDRLASVDGTLEVRSSSRHGTTVTMVVPCA